MVTEDSAAESSQPKGIRAGQRLLTSAGLRRRGQGFPLGLRSTIFECLPCQQTRAGSLWGKARRWFEQLHMARGILESNIQRGGQLSQETGKSMQGDRNSMSDDIIANTPRKRKTHSRARSSATLRPRGNDESQDFAHLQEVT